jgi:hypothetical protein
MPIPKPKPYERQNDFLQRCMGDEKMVAEYDTEQRAAICRSAFEEKMAGTKISFDYDGTLSTAKGLKKALDLKESGAEIYIISARSSKDGMLARAKRAGILESRIYATGSNEAKVQKIKDLNIEIHFDNNPEVINQLPLIGRML